LKEGLIMQDRRTFLTLAAAALMPLGLDAQAPAAGPRQLARHALSGPLEAFEVVLVELTPGPGAGRDHRHPGPVLGYVVDGQVRFGVDHGPEQIVPAGAMFFEPTGAVHSMFASATNANAKVLAFMVVPKGSPLTTPA
jgi:quercetin dioxygenase-like cupin family protein